MNTKVTGAMTVGELSRRTGVSVKALREYTDWGLINTLGRSSSNYRLYDAGALWCVKMIGELRSLGLTIAEIRCLFNRYPDRNGKLIGPRLAHRLGVARDRVGQQIARLEQTYRRIEEFEAAHCSDLAGRSCARAGAIGAEAGLRCA